MKIFKHYLLKYKKVLALALLSAGINQIFSLLNPQIFRIILDNYAAKILEYSQHDFIKGVGFLLLAYIGIALISRTAKAFQDYFVNVVSEQVGTSLYGTAVQHIFKLPFSIFEDEQSGSILQKMQRARDAAKKYIRSLVNIGFFSLVGIIFVVVYSFSVHWLVGTVFLLSIPLVGGIIFITGRQIKRAQRAIIKHSAELAASTTETLQNVGLVKSLGLENEEIERLNTVNDEILKLELKKVIILRKLSFIQGTIVNVITTLVIFISMILIFKGVISVGEFLALWVYSLFVFGPLGQIADLVQGHQETQASLLELNEILSKEVEEHDDAHGTKIQHIESIQFNDVSFSYHGNPEASINNISLSFREGDTIAFAGPSGSGKSTLIKLLLGLYNPIQGSVLINNIPIQGLNLSSLRKKVGYVPQESQVFAGTIRENLLFAAGDASDDDCMRALKQAQIESLVLRSEKGLDTVIGENGIKLSGGEKQRLSIARALIRNPEILIFDEATSSLDSITEKEISSTIEEIRRLHPKLIMVMIAHRLSTIEKADHIYVLRKGSLVEHGEHDKLIDHNRLYKNLWLEQQGAH
ncbi:MAG: ABC transporter ATP-binding protein [Candidatus Pacebacteria bacterium]|nr:ABC transporter ATP-binding protein [Candidatus Paceibacterota bacterium]